MIGNVRISQAEFDALFDEFGRYDSSLGALLERVNVTVDPALDPEPTGEGVVVLDSDDDAWYRRDDGWSSPANGLSRYSWEELIEEFGPVKVYKAVK